jgi:hypothetical protein
MAAFDYLTKKDRMALVHYVQQLGGYPNASGDADAMRSLFEELAAPGEKTNNRIPVSMAMLKLEQEYVLPEPLRIRQEDESEGAALLRRTVTDEARAARALESSPIWRRGPDDLARSLLPGLPGNGFSSLAATLKPDEWKTLYGELMKRLPVE